MTEYVTSALFVHTEDTTRLIKPLQNNSLGTQITSVAFDKRIILMEILAREPLTREDLTAFKRKIQANFNKKLIIRIKTFYIP
jgi:hypothetical protein